MIILEISLAVAAALVILLFMSMVTVKEGTVAVVTSMGKYKRMLQPGLSFITPFVDRVHKRISIQNQSVELEFTSITSDQANVDFKTTFLYRVADNQEQTVKKVAFAFIDDESFMQTLIRSVEGTIRSYVARKCQCEILSLRTEITDEVHKSLDKHLESWGYDLIDIQINDIIFDEAIMRSMAQVVASENLKRAAENEGQAALITRTKAAEAEKIAQILEGEGEAQMRTILNDAMIHDAENLRKAGLEVSLLMFQSWIDGVKYAAEHGEGNVIFMDGSVDGMEKMMKQSEGMTLLRKHA